MNKVIYFNLHYIQLKYYTETNKLGEKKNKVDSLEPTSCLIHFSSSEVDSEPNHFLTRAHSRFNSHSAESNLFLTRAQVIFDLLNHYFTRSKVDLELNHFFNSFYFLQLG